LKGKELSRADARDAGTISAKVKGESGWKEAKTSKKQAEHDQGFLGKVNSKVDIKKCSYGFRGWGKNKNDRNLSCKNSWNQLRTGEAAKGRGGNITNKNGEEGKSGVPQKERRS